MGTKKTQPVKVRSVPQRTCIICQTKTDKRQLTRIVRTPEQTILLDPTGKKNGRGAYICNKSACWEKMKLSQLLDRALEITITPEDKIALADQHFALMPVI